MRVRESENFLKPEIELLLCCARKSVDGAHAERVKEILLGSIDWKSLFSLATQNGLLPLLCENLKVSNPMPVQFREANRQNALRTFFLTGELLRIVGRFSQKNIPALPYKGPVLSQIAYDNPLLRQFDDLDFVAPQRFIPDIYQEMALLGYEPKFRRPHLSKDADANIPGEYVFLHKVNHAMVEIHTEATLRHFPNRPNIEDMSRRSMEITLNGRQVSTFCWADTLLMLCVHSAKDFWSRLLWISDIAEIVGTVDPAGWERVSVEAKKCGAERMLRLGLWLAQDLFGSAPPASILREVGGDRTAARIGKVLCEQLLRQKTQPQGVAWRSRYRIQMVQSSWKGILYWWRLSTAPTEEDWASIPNWTSSGIQHALLRPLRLWRKYRRSIEANK